MTHPLALPGNRSGAYDMTAGDRVVDTLSGRRGVADEFLHDGEALISWDDGSFGAVHWCHLRLDVAGAAVTPGTGRE